MQLARDGLNDGHYEYAGKRLNPKDTFLKS